MKYFFINHFWEGNFVDFLAKAFENIGEQIYICNIKPYNHWSKNLKLHHINAIKSFLDNMTLAEFNKTVIESIKKVKPDVFFSFNNNRLFPETVKKIKEDFHCETVCLVADNPFDSYRDKYFALSLPYFHILLVGDRMWIPNIRRMAPQAKIFHTLGGYDPDIFKPVDVESISETDKKLLECEISFTGSAYGELAEGNYRAGILGSLSDYNVKIWGDTGWKYRARYYPSLAAAYSGKRLPYDQLLKLFTLSKINLNMPSPQILSAFQPRVFEIAATKGFQIIDYREDLSKCFNEDEMVTFTTIPELKEKIDFYLKNPVERKKISEKMYFKTINFHTWEHRAKEYLAFIR